MAAPAPTTFDLDASALAADVLTVDALARIQLSAHRHGRRLRLWRASDELRELIELVGLGDALGVEPRREPEQREQRVGVEEERELDDPAA
jgi:hypothetical protein